MSEMKIAGRAEAPSRLALPFWAFLLIVVGAAAGTGLILKGQEHGYLSTMIAGETDQRIELLISASVDDIISEDVPRLETILEQVMLNDPDVYSIRISDEDDKVLVSQKKAANAQSGGASSFMGSEFPLERMVKDIRFEGDRYGRMAVEWSTMRSGTQIDRHAYTVAFAVAIVGLLFAFLGYWFGRSRA